MSVSVSRNIQIGILCSEIREINREILKLEKNGEIKCEETHCFSHGGGKKSTLAPKSHWSNYIPLFFSSLACYIGVITLNRNMRCVETGYR